MSTQNRGWLEAAVAWEVCASIHQKWAKGKDALFTTRHTDFVKHADDARAKAKLYAHPPQQRKPLTKVQITELAEQCGYDGAVPTVRLAFQGFKLDDFARAIERAHGIGEAP